MIASNFIGVLVKPRMGNEEIGNEKWNKKWETEIYGKA